MAGGICRGMIPCAFLRRGMSPMNSRSKWTWRSGKKSVVRQAKANFIYEIDEAGAVEIRNSKSEIRNPKVQVQNAEVRTSSDSEIANRQLPVTSYQLPVTSYQLPITSYQLPVTNSNTQSFFQDASAMLQHVHHEEAFDDFARQPLLPKLLSQLGPGVAWADCDLDGHDDLIIGCGKNGTLAFYRNEGNGQFSRPALPVLNQPLADDSAGLVAMVSGAGRVSVGWTEQLRRSGHEFAFRCAMHFHRTDGGVGREFTRYLVGQRSAGAGGYRWG